MRLCVSRRIGVNLLLKNYLSRQRRDSQQLRINVLVVKQSSIKTWKRVRMAFSSTQKQVSGANTAVNEQTSLLT